MKRKITFLSMALWLGAVNAQIGMGTANPRGALDINRPTTNKHGLVLPTNASQDSIKNPMGGSVAIGTMIFDSTADCVKVFKSTGWSNCLCDSCDGTTVIPLTTLDCANGALTGTYTQGTASNGTKVINYTGGNGQAYGAISIASTGVTGLTASAPAGTFANGNGSITLNITGTPNTSGTASFTVNLGGKSCTFTVTVGNNGPVVATLDCSRGTLTGTYTEGTASNGTKVVNYTGGNGRPYGAVSIASTGVTGLTATAPAGTLANGNGSITLNITGTPNTLGTASFTVNLGGKSCTFTVTVGNNRPIVATLDCSRGALTGTYTVGTTSNGTKVVNYTGGNGRPYGAINIASTGVTGLTATAPAGTLANGNGSITFNITGTPNTSGTASFTVNLGGQSCTFDIMVQAKTARRMTILSITPDAWRSNLSTDSYTSTARSKLNNTANFGPSGSVKVQGFNYTTIDVRNSSDQAFRNAIDNADIIWVGYITNRNFPQSKRNILAQKIAEKKKFFYLGADGGSGFFPFSSFAGYSFQSTPNNRNARISATNIGPTNGVFGNIPSGSTIIFNRYIGAISSPSSASRFMDTDGGRPTGIINDNLIIIGDINWYINRSSPDGFYGGNSSCTQNNNSKLFCNIFQKAIEYVLSKE
ncbi:hypothetical protein IQ37_13040 [Chryseobacterium piperi]|uniref:Uncharacterized protein n=1 Tax=Chryseobacterium piperi TaxID=558152 RepID=A0A086B6Z1_9FLAO|nr:hypothetical protein [Chryseobacterium piperi]ASW76225.1 hypothetical protein CJF12_19410 [Chryseobacterium piperi]KFF24705.1 hypothetical protein IQ37_13040 [Chryseobacterium piperi]